MTFWTCGMMGAVGRKNPPEFVSAGAITTDISSPFNIAAPAGIKANDVLLCFITRNNTAGIDGGTITTDFTVLEGSVGGSGGFLVLGRTATGTEPGSWTATGGNGSNGSAVIVAYRGVTLTGITDLMNDSTTSNIPTISATRAGKLVAFLGHDTVARSITGLTNRAQTTANIGSGSLTIADADIEGAGVVGGNAISASVLRAYSLFLPAA